MPQVALFSTTNWTAGWNNITIPGTAPPPRVGACSDLPLATGDDSRAAAGARPESSPPVADRTHASSSPVPAGARFITFGGTAFYFGGFWAGPTPAATYYNDLWAIDMDALLLRHVALPGGVGFCTQGTWHARPSCYGRCRV